jgi:hypothetical protein
MCTKNINNALLSGLPAATRKNRVVGEDIIPYTKCKKGLLNKPCADVIKTDKLWENLDLPYDEIKAPGVYLFGFPLQIHRDKQLPFREAVEDYCYSKRISLERTEKNYYNLIKNCGLTEQDSLYLSLLKASAAKDILANTEININSILLCLGYGGIIHPESHGQKREGNIWEWVLMLKETEITQEAYAELARLFLYELTDEQKATFISLCFDSQGRYDNWLIYGIESADVWAAGLKFIDILLEMDNYLLSNGYQDIEVLHKYLLFESALQIINPTSAIGESGPKITIEQDTEYAKGDEGISAPRYTLKYKSWSTYLSIEADWKCVQKFFREPQTVTVYKPANDEDSRGDVGALVRRKITDKLLKFTSVTSAAIDGNIDYARDMSIDIVTKIMEKELPELAGEVVGGAVVVYDIWRDMQDAQEIGSIYKGLLEQDSWENLAREGNLTRGVAVYSDESIPSPIFEHNWPPPKIN